MAEEMKKLGAPVALLVLYGPTVDPAHPVQRARGGELLSGRNSGVARPGHQRAGLLAARSTTSISTRPTDVTHFNIEKLDAAAEPGDGAGSHRSPAPAARIPTDAPPTPTASDTAIAAQPGAGAAAKPRAAAKPERCRDGKRCADDIRRDAGGAQDLPSRQVHGPRPKPSAAATASTAATSTASTDATPTPPKPAREAGKARHRVGPAAPTPTQHGLNLRRRAAQECVDKSLMVGVLPLSGLAGSQA